MIPRHLTCVFVLWSCTDELRKAGCRSGRSQFTEKATSDLSIETAKPFPVGLYTTTPRLEAVEDKRIDAIADRKTLHGPALLYTSLPVGRAFFGFLDIRLLLCKDVWKHFCLICVNVFVLMCNYHVCNAKQRMHRQSKRLDYMEHWGVTLLLLYRAIACLAAPL